ncbi:Pantothenate transporter liz1 [Pseudocercospora fuligena]|uniref:Pantothenate transporter liz1 n=1 Tax=Pseudocercospora fuligena TaxID=685502 RepID=A0A8H6RA32_9PEZI|nr:Pantothenate transporter liz1 [Pseudocercospora fuligena]
MASSTAKEEFQVHADELIQKQLKRNWQSYIWDSLDKSPEERKFLFKLDAAILTFAALGYFIKNLDQTNINNAFVSGMKEDLSLYGNQLNYMQTAWTVGYVIGEISSNLILSRVRPSIWIPSLELVWTVLTFATSRCNTAGKLYAVRFLVGLAESGFYPGMQYVIGSWYRRDELAKRSCIFHTSGAIASMFSGYLMAAVYNLEGVGGFRGWQWLFLVDGIISLPIALSGYFFLPDMPSNCRAVYFNEEEKALARKRMQLEGRQDKEPYTRAKVLKIFKSWHIYALTILYITFNNGNNYAAPAFSQFLKASTNPKYQVWQINVYPTTTYAIQIVTTLIYAWTSDSLFRGARWPAFLIGGSINIACYVSLAVWNISITWKWAVFVLAGSGYGLSGMAFAWAHEICSDDNEERAIVTAFMNEMAYVFQAWLPLVVWQQVTAPRYQKGYITVTFLSATMMATALPTRWLHKREVKRKAASRDNDAESSAEEVDNVQPEVVQIKA